MSVVTANAGIYLLGAAWCLILIDSAIVQIVAGVILAVLAFEGIAAMRELKRRKRTEPENR